MPMEKLKVVLKDSQGNENISGKLIVDENEAAPFDLPAEFSIEAGKYELEARCPEKRIKGENPKLVNVRVRTDPSTPVQKEVFELDEPT